MDPQLQQLIELQTDQNQLLRKYLWRIRFSLLTLLLLTTAVCCGLGFLVYKQQTARQIFPPSITPAPMPVRPAMMGAPVAPPQPQPAGAPLPDPDLFGPPSAK
jgi:hypothetical protein